MVDRINRRFHNTKPGSGNLNDIGVIVHGTSVYDDPQRPWKPQPPRSDRMSAVVVYSGKANSFGGGGGIVLNPAVGTRLFCAYGGAPGGSAGSATKVCTPPGQTASCTPGCITHGWDKQWCEATDSGLTSDVFCDGSPWRPADLGAFIERDKLSINKNELVLDGFYLNEHLPSSVEAFLSSGTPEHAEIYQRFLDTYGLSEELVPLLIYNKAHPNPFQLTSASGSTKYEVHSGNLDGLGFGRA